MKPRLTLALVYGSARDGRFCDTVAGWVLRHLRQVFAEVGAATIRETVSFANAWEQFDAEGTPRAPEDALRRLRALAAQLNWWMTTLKHGRETVVLQEVA